MRKKLFGLVLTGCLIVSSTALAAGISLYEAVRFAAKEVPASANLQNVEPYQGVIGVTFRDFTSLRNYVVFVDDQTGKPCERVMSGTNLVGSTNVLLNKKQITKLVFDRYKDVDKLNIDLYEENFNNVCYRVRFVNKRYAVTALYNPSTGALGKEHILYRW